MIETLVFAAFVVLLFAAPLAAAAAPAELATLRRWRAHRQLHRRIRRYAAAWYRDGVDIEFRLQQLYGRTGDRETRTLPRHRLAGGGGR